MNVGILALQGGFEAHRQALIRLGHRVALVRNAEDFSALDGLILPGGESSVHLKLIQRFSLQPALQTLVESGKPVLATCAGMILCAQRVCGPQQVSFGWLSVGVQRNGFGRQLDSFEGVADGESIPLCFIRAPRVLEMGPGVEVLLRFRGEPVLLREGNVVGATFHPELTDNLWVHRQVFPAATI